MHPNLFVRSIHTSRMLVEKISGIPLELGKTTPREAVAVPRARLPVLSR